MLEKERQSGFVSAVGEKCLEILVETRYRFTFEKDGVPQTAETAEAVMQQVAIPAHFLKRMNDAGDLTPRGISRLLASMAEKGLRLPRELGETQHEKPVADIINKPLFVALRGVFGDDFRQTILVK